MYVFKVTPDILKGQQELVDQPYEDVTKLALFNYLKEGYEQTLQIILVTVLCIREEISKQYHVDILWKCPITNHLTIKVKARPGFA